MIQSSQQVVLNAKSTDADIKLPVSSISSRPGQPNANDVQAATKDAGRVHIGGGCMRF